MDLDQGRNTIVRRRSARRPVPNINRGEPLTIAEAGQLRAQMAIGTYQTLWFL